MVAETPYLRTEEGEGSHVSITLRKSEAQITIKSPINGGTENKETNNLIEVVIVQM